MPEFTIENVEAAFRWLKAGETQVETIKLVEDAYVELAKTVIVNVPRSAHRSAALRDLLQSKMMSIDAIVKGGLI